MDDRDIEVSDPSDIIQQRRINAILDARESVLEARRRALDMRATGHVSERLSARIVKEAVHSYASESEHKIKGQLPGDQFGVQVKREDIDTDEIEKTSEKIAYYTWFQAPLGVVAPEAHMEGVEIYGLKGYLDAQDPMRFSVKVERQDAIGGTETTTVTKTQFIPMDISMNAFSQLNAYWNRMGLDVQAEKKGLPADLNFSSERAKNNDGGDGGDPPRVDIDTTPEL